MAVAAAMVVAAFGAGSTDAVGASIGLPLLGGALPSKIPASGFVGSEPVSGPGAPSFVQTVTPLLSTPAMAGQWQVLPYTAPGLAVHATLMNDGNVLVASGSGNDPQQFAAGTFNVWVWNPAAGTFRLVPGLPTDLFCSGHVLLPNGDVLFVGGTSSYPTDTHGWLGTRTAYAFDPSTGTFTREPDMAYARWYASSLERGDGRVLAVSGDDDVKGDIVPVAEQYDPATSTWSTLPGQQLLPLYPDLTLLANGQVFYSGAADAAGNLHPPGVWSPDTNAFSSVSALQQPGARDQAASILLPPAQQQRIGVFGGGTDTDGSGASSTNAVDVYNVANPSGVVHTIGLPMAAAKMHVLGVILPNETVFETGGSRQFAQNPVAEAAIYNPAMGTWSQMNPPTVPRTYHSEAILLPTGQVATLGSNPNGYAPETRIEVFSPPYMFSGQRPNITSSPSGAAYGDTIQVNVGLAAGATLRKLVLIHPASVTHSDDPNQRLVELSFTGAAGMYAASVPTNPNLTPPGWYMLFALDSSGRPSAARWIRIGGA